MTEKSIEEQLRDAKNECVRLLRENKRLRSLVESDGQTAIQMEILKSQPFASEAVVLDNRSVEEKIALFRSLFKGREDIYALRWESSKGKSGYSPACGNEWDRVLCRKPQIKCSECPNSKFLPVADQVVFDHLSGKKMIGAYPLLRDETCWFLAIDFDKTGWEGHAKAFLKTCEKWGVSAVLERSQSGNGAHVWIFFTDSIPAYLARKLGCGLITQTMKDRHDMSLSSYDRLFPAQDTMPKGGFGNLIALPLQGERRKRGNSVFLDSNLNPCADQWGFLASVRKMRYDEVNAIVQRLSEDGDIIDVQRSLTDENSSEDPWTISPSRKREDKLVLTGLLPSEIKATLANLVYIEKEGLPSPLLNRLKKLAAFQNPEFYKAQAMRISTFGKPRIIGCAEDFPKHIALPRGCLADAVGLLKAHGIQTNCADERFAGKPIKFKFTGELRPEQKKAVKALAEHDMGILSATTAFGKTVVGAWIIAKRKTNTLILVHRQQLMDQWKERLSVFLNIPVKEIGLVGSGKSKVGGKVHIAMLQSLFRKGEVKDLVQEYGQIIVDECHHISAFSFEQVMKQVKAKYILGLTATPLRKDGHHPIIIMQCGPIRHQVSAKDAVKERPFDHVVKLRYTDFSMPGEGKDFHISQLYSELAKDPGRNEMILGDVSAAMNEGRNPLILTERTQHTDYLADRLKEAGKNVIVLKGGMGRKEHRDVFEQVRSDDGKERVIIATGRYIGEGFDDSRLDTLFLAMPISWQGTLQQYVGRLHRIHDGKTVVRVYDYIDRNVPVLLRMSEKRLKKYPSIGYKIE